MKAWFGLALAVALLTSVQDILNKSALKQLPAASVVWGWWFFSLPLLWLGWGLRPGFLPAPDPGFWMVLALDVMLLAIGVAAYVKALQADDLSVTVPLLSFSPLFLLVTSPLMLGEYPRFVGVAGVLLIVGGSYVLFLPRGAGLTAPFRELWRRKGARYMLLVAAVFSVSGNIDKMGVLQTSALQWVLLLNTSLAAALSVILFPRLARSRRDILRHWPRLALIGSCNAAALLIQMTAIQQTQVPYLIAVKRTSILFSALYGFIMLREPSWRQRLAGIVLMLGGVVLILLT